MHFKKNHEDILIIGTDTNSSMGLSLDEEDSIGKFSIPHVNDSGRRFRSYLSINNLSAMSTRFEKKEYATWIHPCGKKKHQIDHFLINKEMAYRVIDAGVTSPLLDSDHQALFVKIRVMKRLKKNVEHRQKMIKLDFSTLSNPMNCNNFCEHIAGKLENMILPYQDLSDAEK